MGAKKRPARNRKSTLRATRETIVDTSGDKRLEEFTGKPGNESVPID